MFTLVDLALSALVVSVVGGWLVRDVRRWLREITRSVDHVTQRKRPPYC
jgi:small-conductance mechanosensitive channel